MAYKHKNEKKIKVIRKKNKKIMQAQKKDEKKKK